MYITNEALNLSTRAGQRADRLGKNLFLALSEISNDENPNVREGAIVRAIEKLHSAGMYLSEEAITHLRGVFCQGGMFVVESTDDSK